MAEAARLLGRDRTRIYAQLRSGGLVAAEVDDDGASDRSSVERWLVAGSDGTLGFQRGDVHDFCLPQLVARVPKGFMRREV